MYVFAPAHPSGLIQDLHGCLHTLLVLRRIPPRCKWMTSTCSEANICSGKGYGLLVKLHLHLQFLRCSWLITACSAILASGASASPLTCTHASNI